MDANDTLSEDEFLRKVTASFFDWIWDEFLPIVLMVLFLIFFVFGVLINATLLVVAARNGWHKMPVHAFIIQLCIVDLLACAFIVLPTLIAVRKEGSAYPNTTESCNFQQFMFSLCLIQTFLFISIAVVERTVRAVSTALYIKCFGNACCVILVVIVEWTFGIIISFLSLLDQEVNYDEDLFLCVVRFRESPALLNVLLVIFYYFPLFVVTFCFVMIFYRRACLVRDACANKRQKGTDVTDSAHKQGVTVVKDKSTSVFYIDKHGRQDHLLRSSLYVSNVKVGFLSANDDIDAGGILKSHQGQMNFNAMKKWKNVITRVQKRKKIVQVFRDKPDDINHHQSMTYLVMWVVMTMCWLLYVVAQYIDVYSERCSPCLRVGMLMGQSTYTCKPLIYIGHNRWYRSTFFRTLKQLFCKRKYKNNNA